MSDSNADGSQSGSISSTSLVIPESDNCAEARLILQSIQGSRPKTDMKSGDVFYEVYDSIERFTADRLVNICKTLNLDEELIVGILKTNMQLAARAKQRISDGRRKRTIYIGDSLTAS